MPDYLAYILFFFSIVFLGLTPFPSLPVILASYLRFSYAAVPLVVVATVVGSVLQYLIGRYFPFWIFYFRRIKANRFMRRLSISLQDVNLETLVFIRSAQFVPSKIFNFCCGVCNVPLSLFCLSLIPTIIVDQFVYLAGASFSFYIDSFLIHIGLHRYHWFILFVLYVLLVFFFSFLSAFLLKIFLRLFSYRLPRV